MKHGSNNLEGPLTAAGKTLLKEYFKRRCFERPNKKTADGNQRLQFTVEIMKPEENSSTHEKEGRVQNGANENFPFLDMKTSWSLEGDLQFGVFRKKEQ